MKGPRVPHAWIVFGAPVAVGGVGGGNRFQVKPEARLGIKSRIEVRLDDLGLRYRAVAFCKGGGLCG